MQGQPIAGDVERQFLAQIPIFAGLPPEALDRIARATRIVTVAAADVVILEGEHAANMFVVRSGQLEICKQGGAGPEFKLAVLQPGDCVGEMSLIDIQPRSATVRALGPGSLYVLDHAEIGRLYQSHPDVYTLLVLNIAREISRRLRRADQILVEMGLTVQDLWSNNATAAGDRVTVAVTGSSP